ELQRQGFLPRRGPQERLAEAGRPERRDDRTPRAGPGRAPGMPARQPGRLPQAPPPLRTPQRAQIRQRPAIRLQRHPLRPRTPRTRRIGRLLVERDAADALPKLGNQGDPLRELGALPPGGDRPASPAPQHPPGPQELARPQGRELADLKRSGRVAATLRPQDPDHRYGRLQLPPRHAHIQELCRRRICGHLPRRRQRRRRIGQHLPRVCGGEFPGPAPGAWPEADRLDPPQRPRQAPPRPVPRDPAPPRRRPRPLPERPLPHPRPPLTRHV
ncbi:MAG: Bacillopeptidase F precursor, partial [uncultured Rubrobacteraceae bacterium]